MWLRRTLALPVQGTGLKEIASHLGFPWRHKGMDGMMVGMMYARYRDRREPFAVEQVMEYNADDVLALPFVVNRVRRLFEAAA
ncbi:MAG: ribonuclease H-like domain-containing protein [Deltaproteobacteria bacterium]|nr:ribonuclease H-like domain-containing protein [Deltaproteobacteria bacterium]